MRKITARAIIEHEGKFLAARLNNSNHFWCAIGGKLDAGESVLDGLRREVIEETGVEPVVGELLFVQQFAIHDDEYTEFFFRVTNSQDYLNIDLTKTSHGVEEIQEMAFIDVTQETVMPGFFATELPQLVNNESVRPTKFFSYL